MFQALVFYLRGKMLFDAHTHLNYEEYSEEERADRARSIGESDLAYIIDVGDNVSSTELAIENAHRYSWCFASAGIHPEHALTVTDRDINRIKELAKDEKVKAIGEIGLDFYYGKDDRPQQIDLFRKQLKLANELRLPIIVHTRDANQLTLDILKEEGAFSDERKSWFPKRPGENGMMQDDARVQLHCYSGSAELALEYVKLGATISLGGPVTFKNGRKAVEVLKAIPIEYIMSETDAPFMAPEPLRGRPNRAEYVEHVVRRMALLKGISYEDAATKLTENGCRFFNIETN